MLKRPSLQLRLRFVLNVIHYSGGEMGDVVSSGSCRLETWSGSMPRVLRYHGTPHSRTLAWEVKLVTIHPAHQLFSAHKNSQGQGRQQLLGLKGPWPTISTGNSMQLQINSVDFILPTMRVCVSLNSVLKALNGND